MLEVTISKNVGTNNFKNYLKSGEIFGNFNYDENREILIVKVPYNSKIDILYSLYNYSNYIVDLNSKLEYSGFYDKEKDMFYDLNFTLKNTLLDEETANNVIEKKELYKKISNEVDERVKELVSEEKEKLFSNDFIIPEINDAYIPKEKDVYEYFIDGITSKELEDSYRNYSTTNPKDILDYITDPQSFIEEESRNFILDNIEDIYIGLYQSKIRRKLLKEIEDDNTKPIHKIKTIIDSIKNYDIKTVNLTINKDGIEQTFKYEVCPLKYSYNSYLSTLNFVSARERAEFVENFGRSTDLYYEDIIKITYGKNTLYEDKNYKKEELKEEICL